jgi:high-affinity iron transporter
MIESFVITLREGVEAALVVCLTLAYLRKVDRPDLRKAVAGGVALAAVLSVAGGIALQLTQFDTEGTVEGIVLLVSCAMVTWLVIWMWRHGKRMKQETEERLGKLAAGSKLGIFLFAFLMVFREGVEMILMLTAAGFTTEGVLAGSGAVAGLVLAVALGVAFYKGTIRVDVRKFFAVTSVILLLFAFQLLASGLHEFAEAGLLKSGPTYMRIVGPLMKHSALFVIAVLVLPFLLMLRRAVAAEPAAMNPAEERKERARSRGERVAKAGFALIGILVIVTLGVAWAQDTKGLVRSDPEIVFDAAAEIAVPLEKLSDGKLHRFAVKAEGKTLRFLAMRKGDKDDYGTAMDACTICFDKGYVQQGDRLVCLHCTAELMSSTLGEGGGCNPIPITPRPERRGEALVFRLEAMAVHASFFTGDAAVVGKCAACGMELTAESRGGEVDGKAHCRMPACEKKLRGR